MNLHSDLCLGDAKPAFSISDSHSAAVFNKNDITEKPSVSSPTSDQGISHSHAQPPIQPQHSELIAMSQSLTTPTRQHQMM